MTCPRSLIRIHCPLLAINLIANCSDQTGLLTRLTKFHAGLSDQYVLLFGLILYIPVNSYGYVGTVSSSNHTFSCASLTKQLTGMYFVL